MTRFLSAIFITFIALVSSSPSSAEEKRFYRSQVIDDVDYVKRLLRKLHPNLYAHRTKLELEEIWNRLEKNLGDNPSQLEAASVIQQILASVCDLHTSIKLDSHLVANNFLDNKVFPVGLAVEKDRLYLDDINLGYQTREVLSINDKSQSEIIEYLRSVHSVDGCQKAERFFTAHIGNLYFSSALLTYFIGPGSDFKIKIRDTKTGETYERLYSAKNWYRLINWDHIGSAKRSQVLRKIGITARDELWKFPQGGFFVKSNADKSVYYVYVPSFEGRKSWIKRVDRSLRELVRANPKHVIVDLTDNSGGRRLNAQRFLSYFLSTSSRYGVSVRTKINRVDFEPGFEWHSKEIKTQTSSYLRAFNKVKKRNGQYKLSTRAETFGNKSYNGKLTVLVSPRTSSAATFAAITLKRKANAKIVGDIGDISLETACSLSPGYNRLKHSGIRVSVTYECVDRHPDAKTKGDVTVADVPVDILSSSQKFLNRSILEHAIESDLFLKSQIKIPSAGNSKLISKKTTYKNTVMPLPDLELTEDEIRIHERKLANSRKANRCDLLAASNFDEERLVKQGVGYQELFTDSRDALYVCRKAIEKYPEDSQINYQFARSLHASKRYSDAAVYYRKAVASEHVGAEHNLATLLLAGQGVMKNPGRAKKIFSKLAGKGYVLSSYALGVLYYRENEYENAAVWWSKSDEQGTFPKARIDLDQLYLDGRGLKTMNSNHWQRHFDSAQGGNWGSMLILAHYYDQRRDDPHWRSYAAQYFANAINVSPKNLVFFSKVVAGRFSIETRKSLQKLIKKIDMYDGPIDGKLDSELSQKALEDLKKSGVKLPKLPLAK